VYLGGRKVREKNKQVYEHVKDGKKKKEKKSSKRFENHM